MADKSEILNKMDDEDLKGFSALRVGRRVDEAAVARFIRLRDNLDGLPPGAYAHAIEEAQAASDFPMLTQYVTQREVIARYRTSIPEWLPMVKTEFNNSFITAEKIWKTGIPDILPKQIEGQERAEVYQSELKMRRGLEKFGAKSKITFEARVNDQFGEFRDMPQQFADAARATEAYYMAAMLVNSSGVNTDLIGDAVRAPVYDSDNALVTDARNPTVDNLLDSSHDALTIEHLKLAIKQQAGMTDFRGRKMGLRAKFLVIPPALELDAIEILQSTNILYAATASSAVPLPTVNAVARYGLTAIVNEFLPVVNTTSTGDTQWFVTPAPAQGSALFMTYLRGMQDPQVFMKASNKQSTSGGALGQDAGDFDTDDVEYAVRHIFKVNRGDPRFIVGATGDTA